MIIGMVGVLGFLMVHLTLGGVIIIGVRVGLIGDHIIIVHHIITDIIIIRLTDHLIIEEMEFIDMKGQHLTIQIDDLT
jgi:hypothetical protein